MNSISSDTPGARLGNGAWRRRHSAWLLAPIFGFGLFSFVGFVYVAFRVREKRWWRIAALFCVVTAVGWTLMSLAEGPDHKVDRSSPAANAGTAVVLVLWIGSIVYGFILNRDYLRWRAGRTAANAWYNDPAAPDPRPATPASGRPLAPAPILGVDTADYYAATTVPASTTAPARPQPQPSASVDINTAPEDAIAAVPGLDAHLAARITAERARRGSFADMDELTAVVGLQPHQVVRARGYVTFSAPAPPHPTTRPAGRILDI